MPITSRSAPTTVVSRSSTKYCARKGFERLADAAKSAVVRFAFENGPFTHHVKTTEDAVGLSPRLVTRVVA